jgi:hypothetical protein
MAGPWLWEWEKEELEQTVGFGLDGVQGCDGVAECFRYIRWTGMMTQGTLSSGTMR